MKGQARTILGYLAAFTMGVICMGVIALVVLNHRSNSPPAQVLPDLPSDPVPPESAPRQPQTFQRLHRDAANPAPELSAVPNEQTAQQPPSPDVEQPEIVAIPVPVNTAVRQVVIQNATDPVNGVAMEGGRISGKVTFSGEPPPEKKIILDPWCAAKWAKLKVPALTRLYVTGKDRALADVVITIRSGMTSHPLGSPFPASYTIAMANCNFEPSISAIKTGQRVVVQNRDGLVHHLHLTSVENGEFKRAQLPGTSARFTFNHPEDFARFSCDVHPWEFAYISVFDQPFFAVTDKNGAFVIQRVPPGIYTVEARHRKAGTLVKEVTVESFRNLDIQFEFELPPAQTAFVHQ